MSERPRWRTYIDHLICRLVGHKWRHFAYPDACACNRCGHVEDQSLRSDR